MNTLRTIGSALLSIEIYPISILAFFGFFIADFLFLAVWVGLFFGLLRWLLYRRLTLRSPSDIAILLLVLLSFVSLWATSLPDETFTQVVRLWVGVLLYYAIINWAAGASRIRTVTVVAVIGVLVLSLYGIISVDWSFDKLPIIPTSIYTHLPSLPGLTEHRNVIAGYLVLLLPLTLGVLLFAWFQIRFWQRLFLSLVALVGVTVLVLTQSRGALLSFAGLSLLLIGLRWKWGWLAILVSGVGGILLGLYIGLERSFEFISSGASLGGLEGRLDVWSRALYMIQDFAFTGIGMGSFLDLADAMYPFFISPPGTIPHAHNILLQVAVDLGIPGLIAWLSIFILVLLSSWQVYRSGRQSHNAIIAGLGAGLFLSQIALLTHGMFDAVTWGMIRVAPIVWVLWGLAAASANLISKEPQ